MILAKDEVPVAYSMMALASHPSRFSFLPLQDFVCYWTAFNNIYVTVAAMKGRARLKRSADGEPETRRGANVRIPKIASIREKDQINLVFGEFSDELTHRLVEHTCTRFFVYRTPRWRGCEIEFDALHQRLNGVINVGYTVDVDYPV